MSDTHDTDSSIRAWLTSRKANVLPGVYNFPLGLINEKASQANQARDEAIIEDAVDRYSMGVKRGDIFPPIVIYYPGGGSKTVAQLYKERAKANIVDGNNRYVAFKRAGKTEIPAIILAADTPSEIIYLLTVEANTRNGEPVSREFRLRQAVHLNNIGWNIDVACQAAGIPRSVFNDHKKTEAAKERARRLGAHKYASLPKTQQVALARIKDDRPFVEVVSLCADTAMNTDDLNRFMKEFRACTSEQQRAQLVQSTRDSRRVAAATQKALASGRSRTHSPKHDLATSIGKLLKVDPGLLAGSILRDEERAHIMAQLESVATHVFDIMSAIERWAQDGDKRAS